MFHIVENLSTSCIFPYEIFANPKKIFNKINKVIFKKQQIIEIIAFA